MDLYLARVTKKITQWELALRTGISQSQLSLYERGYREPSQEAKEKIAGALDMPADQIEFREPKGESINALV